jgi:hypothetical protein
MSTRISAIEVFSKNKVTRHGWVLSLTKYVLHLPTRTKDYPTELTGTFSHYLLPFPFQGQAFSFKATAFCF